MRSCQAPPPPPLFFENLVGSTPQQKGRGCTLCSKENFIQHMKSQSFHNNNHLWKIYFKHIFKLSCFTVRVILYFYFNILCQKLKSTFFCCLILEEACLCKILSHLCCDPILWVCDKTNPKFKWMKYQFWQ